jgi:hypothetical protein
MKKLVKPQPKPAHRKADLGEIAYFVREGKECQHSGVKFLSGQEFTPFDDLSLEFQNLHLPNLERRSVEATPEEIVEVIDQETEFPTSLEDVLI